MKIRALSKRNSLEEKPQEALREEFGKAEKFDEIRIGQTCLFYRGFLRIRFVLLEDCKQIFLRVEFGEYGEFPLHEHYIVVRTKRGEEFRLRMEHPDEAKKLMVFLEKYSDEIELGKSPKESSDN